MNKDEKEKLNKVKLALEVIKKRIITEPKNDTFEFTFEEFTSERSPQNIPGWGIADLVSKTERLSLIHLFKTIEKESKKVIEFDFPERKHVESALGGLFSPFQLREMNKPIFYVYVSDLKDFNEYYKKIVQPKKVSLLILNDDGELYRPDDKDKKLVYLMNPEGLRYKTIYYLAKEKRWVMTRELAEEFKRKPQKIRKTFEQIRRQIEKFIKISGDKIIENKKGLGYRIRNIRIRKI